MHTLEQLSRAAGDRPVAVVYPAYTMAAYAVIRNLGERGVPVVALNPWEHPHMHSRWVTPVRSPNFTESPRAFVDTLKAIARDLPGGIVLYLMEDVYVYLIHRFKDELPANVRFPFMDDEALAMSLDKRAMFDAAARAGLPLPWTAYPTTLGELEDLRGEIPFPCLIKPLVSRFSFGDAPEAQAVELFPKTFGGKCARAEDFDGLKALFARAQSLGIPVCVQELLIGPMEAIYGVHLYADAEHRILGAATGRKLRQLPGDFGTGTLCEVLRRDDALQYARDFVREARYHGIGGLEFMEDARTGQLKLIEINPRGVHWLDTSRVAGVDLPYLKYADLIGRPFFQAQKHHTGRWVDGRGDVAFWRRYARDTASPYHRSFGQWLAPLFGASPAVMNWRDPLPGLLGLVPKEAGARYLAFKQRLGRLSGPAPSGVKAFD
jgi:predicted ATP-grasp superfamily ATP-dependent carboligase